jgi:hypothetical protein
MNKKRALMYLTFIAMMAIAIVALAVTRTLDGYTVIKKANILSFLLNSTEVTATGTEINTAADLSVNGGLIKVKKISISSTPNGSEQDTSWDLPAKAIVLNVYLDVTTAEVSGTTKHIDVGTKASESGDADGWLDGVDVSTTGIKKGVFSTTTGSNNSYVVSGTASHTRGLLLRELNIGGEDTAAGGDGVAAPGWDTTMGGKSVVYTAAANNFTTFRGAIYIIYMEIG